MLRSICFDGLKGGRAELLPLLYHPIPSCPATTVGASEDYDCWRLDGKRSAESMERAHSVNQKEFLSFLSTVIQLKGFAANLCIKLSSAQGDSVALSKVGLTSNTGTRNY